MGSRASIVGAAETSVGKVRDHNEDSHFFDPDAGIFIVCDGMGGHAAGEVASALAVQTIRERWTSEGVQELADKWLASGTADAHRAMMDALHDAVTAAHEAILAEGQRDRTKGGMGTTLVGAMVIGGDVVFAQCGDSRAYLVRDGIAMQLTEDHTLLARLLAAGVDVDVNGDGARFKSMLTNALGIGQECKVSTFVVPVADGDRFLLCSDGITEYVQEAEIGEALSKQPSPARAAQRLVDLALERGGGDNATALVVRVLEAGETARPADVLKKEQAAIEACPLWGGKLSPQQRLRALRIALPRDHVAGERIPAVALGDRVAWIILDGEVDQAGVVRGPGALLYPEALLADRPLPDRDGLAVTQGEVRALAIRSDDFRELCEDDAELGEALLEALAAELAARAVSPGGRRTGKIVAQPDADARGPTDPGATSRAAGEPPDGAEPMADDDVPEIEITAGAADETEAAGEAEEAAAEAVAAADAAATAGDQAVVDAAVAAHEPPALPRTTTGLGGRSSSERLILAKEERAAVAADLEEALTKLTVDDGWADEDGARGNGEAEAEAEPEPARIVPVSDRSEPEISILAGEDVVGHDPSAPREIVNTVETDSARVVEIVRDTSSQTMILTVDEPPEPEVIVVQDDAEPAKRADTAD